METTKFSFWTLLNQYKINIPIIQRDYAQGRNTEKAITIRNSFLQNLFESINENATLDLDFVYGSVKNLQLIPLDGQQRLTTLFLLHWYLASIAGKINESKKILGRFTYETRTSAKEFCFGLIDKGITFSENNLENGLSNSIKDSHWFFLSWEKDPTVKSMLTMLDTIHEKFKDKSEFFDKMIKTDNPLITFQFIAIDTFGLTDNLYIKMNARGKALTDFENVKAKFEQFLEKNHPNKKKDFAEKIDGVWTDFFWKHKQDNLIDIPFMRYFGFITEMLYYLENSKELFMPFGYTPKIGFDFIEEVYKKEDNIDFLFSSLDWLSKIKDTNSFFKLLFTSSSNEKGKVVLFENNIDLFSCCIRNEGFGIKERVLLFSIINYIIIDPIEKPNENILDLVRVIRNLLLRVRQQNNIVINSNLRIENIPNQIYFISSYLTSKNNVYQLLETIEATELNGFSKDSINFEKDKAKLIISNPQIKNIVFEIEDYPLFTGSIHNLDIQNNVQNLEKYYLALKDIWSNPNDSLITRAMLTIEDYSVSTGGSKLGEKWFFGNGNNWLTILTHPGEQVKQVLPKFLDKYIYTEGNNSTDRLVSIINMWLQEVGNKNWRYYFIKYAEITKSKNNNYAWKNDFEIRQLSGSSLLAYHINPYVKAAVTAINDENICEIDDCEGQYAEESPLVMKNGIKLYSKNDSWEIVLPDTYELATEIINEFTIEHAATHYLLKETSNKDRIEIAISFCKSSKVLNYDFTDKF